MSRTLIQGGMVISMERGIGDLPKGDILVDGETIARVGRSLRAPGAKVVDATGKIVIPGLVNAHLHTWQTGIRGIAGNWTIARYLELMHAAIAPRYSANDTYLGNLVGALNQISNGATTIFDWCHNNATPGHTDAAIAGLREAGIRALFGHGSPKPAPREGAPPFTHIPHPASELARLRKTEFSSEDGLLGLAMAALGVDFSIWEVVEHDFRLAKDLDLVISTHVWGAPGRLNPDGYARLGRLGLLDRRHNLVHGNHLSDRELRLVLDSGASVTVTPEVELQMSHGTPLVGRLRALGARPSLGVDIESNVSGDMFTVMRMALQPLRQHDNKEAIRKTRAPAERLAATARDALRWATVDSARALGMERRIGSLKPGKQADIVLLDARALNMFPVHDPVESVVFQANGGNVDTVMIAGRVLKRNGKLLYRTLDEKMDRLARSGRRILKGVRLAA